LLVVLPGGQTNAINIWRTTTLSRIDTDRWDDMSGENHCMKK